MNAKQADRIDHLFRYMEYDYLTDAQMEYVVSVEKQFKEKGVLTDRQIEVLEDINKQADERDRPVRR